MLPKKIYKEKCYFQKKSGTVTKVKLRNFKKHNQHYFGTLVLAS